ncbi:MAG: GspH/FimT family pseudopilin [Tahibacter sp.]
MRTTNGERQNGTTLMELLTVIAIIAITLGIGLPGFGNLRQRQEMSNARSQLTLALAQARSRAVMSHSAIVMCPSSDGETCLDTVFWQHGWLAFVDTNRDGKRDFGESRVDLGAPLNGVYIASTEGRRQITYHPDGSAPGSNITLTLCDRRGPGSAIALAINNGGRVRLATPAAGNVTIACAGG